MKVTKTTIGQYSDYINISDFLEPRCGCGQKAVVSHKKGELCEGCKFRHTVMKAAGREQEFWDARPKPEEPAGWASYNVKFSVAVPPAGWRIRHIKAEDSTT